jgi:hypothetical protein
MQNLRLFLALIWLGSVIFGCATISVSENSNPFPTLTEESVIKRTSPTPTTVLQSTPSLPINRQTNPAPTVVLRDTLISTPSVLYDGTIKFQIALSTTTYSTTAFDFDSNRKLVPDEQNENDIEFAVSQGTNTVVIVRPINDALDYLFEKSSLDVFSYSECNISRSKFETGGRPLYENLFICVRTNKGNLAELITEDIYRIGNIFYIETRYIVWTESR